MDWTFLGLDEFVKWTELGMDGKSSDALLSDGLAASSAMIRPTRANFSEF